MTVNPNGSIYLCKTKLENDYKNELTFSNFTSQLNYFNSTIYRTFNDYTYIKKDNSIKVGVNIDDIISCNYLFYRNNGFTNKYYFCFITDMEYINENCTLITFETDCFQTWYFQIEYKTCFVEREHVNNDTTGLHTVPENLELGEYVSTKLQPTFKGNYETCFCVACSDNIFTSYSTLNENLPSGLYYFGLTTLQGIKDVIKEYDNAGKSSAVYSVFVIPKEFFSSWTTITNIDGQISTSVRFSLNDSDLTINKPTYLNNEYYPKNNKLLTYPYSFLQVSNHSGSVINYRWEEFNNLIGGAEDDPNICTFSLGGALSIGGSFYAVPIDYKNILNNYDEGIVVGKFPVGGWNTDPFTNWLTQNGVNIGLSLVGEGLQLAGGIGMLATGGGALAGASQITSGGLAIASTLGQIYEHSLAPKQAGGNTNVGDYNFTKSLINLEFKCISIKNEYAEIIDKYFNAYGYKVNTFKVPNITGRENWNYVKTIECNFDGDIPQTDLDIIKQMFNNGVTLWHNPTTMYNYNASNNIL